MSDHRRIIVALARKLCSSLVMTCLCVGLIGSSAGEGAAAINGAGEEYAPGQILIGLKHKPAADGMEQLSSALGANVQTVQPDMNLLVMRVPVGDELKALKQARQNPDVAFAELDYVVHAAERSAALWPNDPGLYQQWALEKMGVPFAWDYSQGSPSVLVAVLDTGVQHTHPDLIGNVDAVNGRHFYHIPGPDGLVAAEDGNVMDDNGHGTHVAGIITAKANNSQGIAGVSSASQVLPVKVLDRSGKGYISDIVAGIEYAVAQGAKIINLSLGSTSDSYTLREAVLDAREQGVLVIAAAGNCLSSAAGCPEPVMYPAAIDTVIAVAASDQNDIWAVFSNVGPEVDLSAPGTDIVSTSANNSYSWGDGTSFAAPQVAGIAALLWSHRPDLSLFELEDLLTSTAEDIEAPGKDDFTGWGRVSANRAMSKLESLSDPFIDCQYVRGALNQEDHFIVRYGNSGYGDAVDATITTSLSVPGELDQEAAWTESILPVGDQPEVLISIPDEPVEGIISVSVQIQSTSLDFETRNNQAICQVSTSWMTFLPYLAKANVSK